MSAIADSFIETAVLDLDALRRMSYAELDSLYRGARCPRVISELNADTRDARLEISPHWSDSLVAAHIWRFSIVSVGRQNLCR